MGEVGKEVASYRAMRLAREAAKEEVEQKRSEPNRSEANQLVSSIQTASHSNSYSQTFTMLKVESVSRAKQFKLQV